LQMTVFPGYGGQRFMSEPLPEIAKLRAAATAAGKPDFTIMVDGGITRDTVAQCAGAGADAFAAGTALFSKADMRAEVAALREVAHGAAHAHRVV